MREPGGGRLSRFSGSIVALILFMVGSLLGPAALLHAEPAKQSATIEVRMVETAFQPRSVTISTGQAVSWTNAGSVAHTTTSDLPAGDPNFWDVTLQPGFTFERIFNTAGTFNYFCKFHRDQGMTGVVIVQQQTTSTATASPSATPSATPRTPTVTGTPPTATPTVTGTPPTPTATGAPGAQPAFFITSPTEGQVITGTEVPVRLEVSNITLRPPGGPNRQGEGHFSLFLDNLPEVQVGDRTYTYQTVAPGNHTLRVELRQNDNTPLVPPLQATVNFRVQTAQAVTPTVTTTRPPVSPAPPTTAPPTTPPTTAPARPTATVGLPVTGDGSYHSGGIQPGWILIGIPLFGFVIALTRRVRRGHR